MAAYEGAPQTAAMSRSGDPDDQWFGLAARYRSIRESIAALGGDVGCEDESEELWTELEDLFHRLAKLKARSTLEVAQKVLAALDMLDESSNELARDLLISVMKDLTPERR